MVKGSCLCKGVRFEADHIAFLGNCHCSMCRKAHGAAFATFAGVPVRAFRFVAGEDLVQRYESSPGNHRAFCRTCGSNVPVSAADGRMVFVPAGLFDDDPGLRPSMHIFVGSKAPWWEINDDLPRHAEYPPA